MEIVIGEAEGKPGVKQVMLLQALQVALDKARPPSPGTDTRSFHVVSIQMEHGGFTGVTKTRITLEVSDGPMDRI